VFSVQANNKKKNNNKIIQLCKQYLLRDFRTRQYNNIVNVLPVAMSAHIMLLFITFTVYSISIRFHRVNALTDPMFVIYFV